MHKRSRPPSLLNARPGPYDRPGFGGRSGGYGGRRPMKGEMTGAYLNGTYMSVMPLTLFETSR